MDLRIYGRAIQGTRNYQEDYFEIHSEDVKEPSNYLIVLCDGMGGHLGGATASQVATTTFIHSFITSTESSPKAALTTALRNSHLALQAEINENGAPPDMGTTLVAVYINDNNLHWISVGDSHLYHYRKGRIVKLNDDHSMASVLDELAAIGRITKDEAIADPQRNALRSCLSADDISLTDIQSKNDFLEHGDKIILASDGLDTLEKSTIEKIVVRHKRKSPEVIVAKLLTAVENVRKPSQDNTTAVLISTKSKFWFF